MPEMACLGSMRSPIRTINTVFCVLSVILLCVCFSSASTDNSVVSSVPWFKLTTSIDTGSISASTYAFSSLSATWTSKDGSISGGAVDNEFTYYSDSYDLAKCGDVKDSSPDAQKNLCVVISTCVASGKATLAFISFTMMAMIAHFVFSFCMDKNAFLNLIDLIAVVSSMIATFSFYSCGDKSVSYIKDLTANSDIDFSLSMSVAAICALFVWLMNSFMFVTTVFMPAEVTTSNDAGIDKSKI